MVTKGATLRDMVNKIVSHFFKIKADHLTLQEDKSRQLNEAICREKQNLADDIEIFLACLSERAVEFTGGSGCFYFKNRKNMELWFDGKWRYGGPTIYVPNYPDQSKKKIVDYLDVLSKFVIDSLEEMAHPELGPIEDPILKTELSALKEVRVRLLKKVETTIRDLEK